MLLGLATGFSLHAAEAPASFEWQRAFLDQYCVACHNDVTRTANFTLQTVALDQVGHRTDEVGVWESVVLKLRAREMPPPGLPRPEPLTYDRLASWLEVSLDEVAEASPNPGRPVIQRLNRAEYTNAIRDLLALEIDGREYLPADDSGYGFDNIGDVLTLSPSLLERYMIAAAKISQLAVGDPNLRPTLQTYEMRPTMIQQGRMNEEQTFGTRGGESVRHYFPLDGEYRIKIRLQRTHANQIRGLAKPHDIEVRFDRARIAEFTVGGNGVINPWGAVMDASVYEQTADDGLELALDVKAGTHAIAVTFPEKRGLPEGLLEPNLSTASYEFAGDRDAPMALGSIEVSGPYNATKPFDTPTRNNHFTCDPIGTVSGDQGCAAQILSSLARRAFRRPVTDDDLSQLMTFYASGRVDGGFDRGIQRALRAILVDPEFLFRIESEPTDIAPATAYRVSEVELASRLSFFLWSSIPDDELLQLAGNGELAKSAVRKAQVKRMLASPKLKRFCDSFPSQWLQLDRIVSAVPDEIKYKDFFFAAPNYRTTMDMMMEPLLLFETVLIENRSILEFIDSKYTYRSGRLRKWYGDVPTGKIGGPVTMQFTRQPVNDRRQGGVITNAAVMTMTSGPDETKPITRGAWIAGVIFNAPPEPPPANVPPLSEAKDSDKNLTLRERFAEHRENATCAGCHAKLDPLGFALENFDPVGRWRDGYENGRPVDASGVLFRKHKFNNVAEFKDCLLYTSPSPRDRG